ncbi:MAG: hypothetical protein FWD69_06175, partial [Polyangiaceae bacterium]|nr:hypothetical protein [Polyangiaceae bacterium]
MTQRLAHLGKIAFVTHETKGSRWLLEAEDFLANALLTCKPRVFAFQAWLRLGAPEDSIESALIPVLARQVLSIHGPHMTARSPSRISGIWSVGPNTTAEILADALEASSELVARWVRLMAEGASWKPSSEAPSDG